MLFPLELKVCDWSSTPPHGVNDAAALFWWNGFVLIALERDKCGVHCVEVMDRTARPVDRKTFG